MLTAQFQQSTGLNSEHQLQTSILSTVISYPVFSEASIMIDAGLKWHVLEHEFALGVFQGRFRRTCLLAIVQPLFRFLLKLAPTIVLFPLPSQGQPLASDRAASDRKWGSRSCYSHVSLW